MKKNASRENGKKGGRQLIETMSYKSMLAKAAKISRDGFKVVMFKKGRGYNCVIVANNDDPKFPGVTGYFDIYNKIYPREHGWNHDEIKDALNYTE